MNTLGLAEGSWIMIGLAILGLFTTIMGIALRATQKSGNLKTMKTMDKKFDIEMDKKVKPINERLENTETDIKDIQKDIGSHTTSLAVMDNNIKLILKSISKIEDYIIK